jgi:hypothetical protein
MEKDCSNRHQDAQDSIANTPFSDGWHQPLPSHLQEMCLENTRTFEKFSALLKAKTAVLMDLSLLCISRHAKCFPLKLV